MKIINLIFIAINIVLICISVFFVIKAHKKYKELVDFVENFRREKRYACPFCGKEVKLGTQVCPNCGTIKENIEEELTRNLIGLYF